MGTETYDFLFLVWFRKLSDVKLNDPLMGTETLIILLSFVPKPMFPLN